MQGKYFFRKQSRAVQYTKWEPPTVAIVHISLRDSAESEDIKAELRVPEHQAALSCLPHLLSFPLSSLISHKKLKGKKAQVG